MPHIRPRPTTPKLSLAERNEEIDFFRDICGWPDDKIEERLGLARGTLAQRKIRARTPTR